MKQKLLKIDDIPAVLYGEDSDHVWLFVHGKCGQKEEAFPFAKIVCPKGAQVLSIDLPGHGQSKNDPGFDPWHAVPELQAVMRYLQRHYSDIRLRANSIGAWFSMLAFADTPPKQALFVSPILDMEKLIRNMMGWAGVEESRLEAEEEISTEFGETLSWQYLQYAIAHPVVWCAPTSILYAGRDQLTSRGTATAFAARFGCELTVMEDGEHWFHTPEQLRFLKDWEDSRA